MPATNKMPDSIRVNLERLKEIAGSQKAITMDRLNSKPKCIEGTTFSFHIPLISQYLISRSWAIDSIIAVRILTVHMSIPFLSIISFFNFGRNFE